MPRIIEAEALEGYRLRIVFDDGLSGEVDLNDRLFGPLFEPLRDFDLFVEVHIDEFGVPCWPNGADVAPDALRRTLKSTIQSQQQP